MIQTEKLSISLQKDTFLELHKFKIKFRKRSLSAAIEDLIRESLVEYNDLDSYNKDNKQNKKKKTK